MECSPQSNEANHVSFDLGKIRENKTQVYSFLCFLTEKLVYIIMLCESVKKISFNVKFSLLYEQEIKLQ